MLKNLWMIATGVFLCFSCVNNSDENHETFNEATDLATLQQMEQEILSFVDEPLCSDSTQCRYIGFGDKPCGGPWYYLIYSMENVDSVELVKKVTAYNAFNRTLNLRYGWVSDCSIPEIPVLGCQDGKCVDVGN